jgi:hypothetical protein
MLAQPDMLAKTNKKRTEKGSARSRMRRGLMAGEKTRES